MATTTQDGGEMMQWQRSEEGFAVGGDDPAYDVAVAFLDAAAAGDVERIARDVWPFVLPAAAWIGGVVEPRYGGDGPLPTPVERLVFDGVTWGTWRWRGEGGARATGGGGTFDDALRDATVVAVRCGRLDVVRALAQYLESVLLAAHPAPSAWFAVRDPHDDYSHLKTFPIVLTRYVAVGAVPLRIEAAFVEGTARRAALRRWFEIVWAAAMESRQTACAEWGRQRFDALHVPGSGDEPDWPRLIVAACVGGDETAAAALSTAAVDRPIDAKRCEAVYDLHLRPLLPEPQWTTNARRFGWDPSREVSRFTDKKTLDERVADLGRTVPLPAPKHVGAAVYALVRLAPAALLAKQFVKEFWSNRLHHHYGSFHSQHTYGEVESLPSAHFSAASLALLRAARDSAASNGDAEERGPFDTLLRLLFGSGRLELLCSDVLQHHAFGCPRYRCDNHRQHCGKWHEPDADAPAVAVDAGRRKRQRQKVAAPVASCPFEQYLYEVEMLCPNDAVRHRFHADPGLTEIVALFHPHLLRSRLDTMMADLAKGAPRPTPPPPPADGYSAREPYKECLRTLLGRWQRSTESVTATNVRTGVWNDDALVRRVARREIKAAVAREEAEAEGYRREEAQHLHALRVCLEHWSAAVAPLDWIRIAAHLPTPDKGDPVSARLARVAAAVPALSWRGGDDIVAEGS